MDWGLVFLSILVATVFLLIGSTIWKLSLRRYSSASS
jgi:ABC-type uncharacterized transport system permease subunit